MKNYEIVNAVFSRDKTGNLINSINTYGRMRNQGNCNFLGYDKVRDLYEVISKLNDYSYQITAEDARILRRYNVLVSPLNACDVEVRDQSFVTLSDFHGYDYPIDKINNYYLNEYDVIFILGDATDRGRDGDGTGSIKLLLDIMNLTKKYPGRVRYLPGNHDEFLLGYIRHKHNMNGYEPYSYIGSLYCNGGEGTIRELNELERTNPRVYNELFKWLSTQPIQRVHKYNGKTFVFGHAIFNQRLYDINPNYCLNDYFHESEDSELRRMAYSVLWFRKDKDRYNLWEMPRSGKTMIIGHTREKQIRGKNIDVCDPAGMPVKVHCVDGGIAYDGGMLKYDGGSSVIWTEMLKHNNTSNKRDSSGIGNSDIIFQDHILGLTLSEGKYGIHKAIFGKEPKELSSEEVRKLVCRNFDDCTDSEAEFLRSVYVKSFLFDYILECQIERVKERHNNFNDVLYESGELTECFIFGSTDPDYVKKHGTSNGNPLNITSSRNARDIAIALGPVAMEEVLRMNQCKSVHDYIAKRFGQDTSKKTYFYS